MMPARSSLRIPLVLLLLVAMIGGALVAVWRLVPRLTQEEVQQTVLTTIEREAPARFLVTGTLDATATVTLRNTKTLLPGVLDLSLGTNRAVVRVPGRIAYGFDVGALRADHIRLGDDGVVEVTLPALRVFSVEPNLGALEVQTTRGWARSSGGAQALQTRALPYVQQALRQQGTAYVNGQAVQARTNTARALESSLRPALEAAGVKRPRFRFDLGDGLVQETDGDGVFRKK